MVTVRYDHIFTVVVEEDEYDDVIFALFIKLIVAMPLLFNTISFPLTIICPDVG